MGQKKLLITIIYLWVGSAFGANFYSFTYRLSKGDSYPGLLKQFVKEGTVINSKSPTVIKTIKMNPKVKDWRKLPIGKKVKLFYRKEIFDMKAYKAYKKRVKKALIAKRKKELKKKKKKKVLAARPNGLKASLFYMTSSGSFNQLSTKDSVNVDFTQNSPYTFGISGLYYPHMKPYSFSASIYSSALNANTTNAGGDITVPNELGLTAYLQHDLYEYGFSYYGGFDYESFSTFNTGQFINSGTIGIDENKVFYLTLGLSKLVKLGPIPLFLKGSFSKSLSTTTTAAPTGVAPTTQYSGFKALFYTNYKFHKRWFAHTLAKYHKMSGPDELSVTRLGIGIGFILK